MYARSKDRISEGFGWLFQIVALGFLLKHSSNRLLALYCTVGIRHLKPSSELQVAIAIPVGVPVTNLVTLH
jgi:hypothetical protein